MTETDPVEESYKGAIRVAATTAMQLATVSQRYIQQLIEKTRSSNEQTAREALSRFNSERVIAEQSLSRVREIGWWDQASPERVSAALSTSYGWREHSETAAVTFDEMKRELHDRFGIEVDSNELNAGEVHTKLASFAQQRDQAEADRQLAAATQERASAHLALSEADQLDVQSANFEARANAEIDPEESANLRAEADRLRSQSSHAQNESTRLYDSAEARNERTAVLEKSGLDPKLVAMRNRADMAQAKPAQAATAQQASRSQRVVKSGVAGAKQPHLSR